MKSLDKIIGLIYFLIAVVAISCVIYKYHSIFKHYSFKADPSTWGQIGDYFGGLLNPIISFTTLIFLIKAYYSQRQELEETKAALEATAEYNRKQTKLMVMSKTIQQLSTKVDITYKQIGSLQDEINRAEACKRNQGDGFGYYFHSNDGRQLIGTDLNNYISDTMEILNSKINNLNEMLNMIDAIDEKEINE
ncbi:hypothetical protein [Aeromonas hydrophila]